MEFVERLFDLLASNTVASDRQRTANQRNALSSTGPRSAAGKAAAARNALRHGLLARDPVLPGEDAQERQWLHGVFVDALEPVGPLEEACVVEIVSGVWRLRRVRWVETGLFHLHLAEEQAAEARARVASHERRIGGVHGEAHDVSRFLGERQITDRPKWELANESVEQASAELRSEHVRLARAFLKDAEKADAFTKLSRYEIAIQRTMNRAQHELERLQVIRRGETG